MFKNYIKVAFRNLLRQKFFSIINVSGLAIGLTCCLLMMLWINDELSYEKYHKNADHIFRVFEIQAYDSSSMKVAVTPGPLANSIQTKYPEIINSCRLSPVRQNTVSKEDKSLNNLNGVFIDPQATQMFTIPISSGDEINPLEDLNSIVITKKTAELFFENENPIGSTLEIKDLGVFNITAIADDLPQNTHIKFDYFISFEWVLIKNPDYKQWDTNSIYTYIHLQNNVDYLEFEGKITNHIKDNLTGAASTIHLQPLKRIHLFSRGFVADIGNHSDIQFVLIFIILSVFVLLISTINFVSLSSARYSKRSKEVALRKVLGSFRIQLVTQFMSESFIMTLVSVLVALVSTEFLLPGFNSLSGKNLSITIFLTYPLNVIFPITIILVGFLSGLYPSFLLSSFQPIKVFKGLKLSNKSGILRKILVVLQWSLSIFMIIGTIVMFAQMKFIRNKDLGYEKEEILYTTIGNIDKEKIDSIKQELLKHPSIENVSMTMSLPHSIQSSISGLKWEGKDDEKTFLIHFNIVDFDFIETFNMKLSEGRSFLKEFDDGKTPSYILNEEAVKQMGIKNPINKDISILGMDGKIIGVLKDFHFKSLHNNIEPIMFLMIPDYLRYLVIKTNKANSSLTKNYIKDTIEKFSPKTTIELNHFSEIFNFVYKTEEKAEIILKYFTILTLVIACLGLFGLAAFVTEQRTKEIGIRKVLGADIKTIIYLLTREFTLWVIVANLIAVPFSVIVMNKVLQIFAYRINLTAGMFFITAVISIFIAILTVSLQTVKAAIANPVKSLKYE